MEFFNYFLAAVGLGFALAVICKIILPNSFNATLASKWILFFTPIIGGISAMSSHYFVNEIVAPDLFVYGWTAGVCTITLLRLISDEDNEVDTEQEQEEKTSNT